MIAILILLVSITLCLSIAYFIAKVIARDPKPIANIDADIVISKTENTPFDFKHDLKSIFYEYRSKMRPMELQRFQKSYRTKVVGVTHLNEDGSSRQDYIEDCYEYQDLFLVPYLFKEPDTWAVAVTTTDFEQLGFLKQDSATEIAHRMNKYGLNNTCTVTKVTGGNNTQYGLNVEIEMWRVHKE